MSKLTVSYILLFGLTFLRVTQVNTIRAAMLKTRVRHLTEVILAKVLVNTFQIPPWKTSLRPHLGNVNYRAAQWKHANVTNPAISPPTGHGWLLKDTRALEPLWCDGDIVLNAWLACLQMSRRKTTTRFKLQTKVTVIGKAMMNKTIAQMIQVQILSDYLS